MKNKLLSNLQKFVFFFFFSRHSWSWRQVGVSFIHPPWILKRVPAKQTFRETEQHASLGKAAFHNFDKGLCFWNQLSLTLFHIKEQNKTLQEMNSTKAGLPPFSLLSFPRKAIFRDCLFDLWNNSTRWWILRSYKITWDVHVFTHVGALNRARIIHLCFKEIINIFQDPSLPPTCPWSRGWRLQEGAPLQALLTNCRENKHWQREIQTRKRKRKQRVRNLS